MSNIVYKGRTQVYLPNVLWNLGSMYSNAREALWEPIANEIDSQKNTDRPKIWVDVYPDRLIITGNGSGMLPVMPQNDEQRLNQFFESGGDQNVDIRDSLSPVAKHSLVWLLNYVSYSPKKQQGGEQQNGVRGIGALAYLTYAKVAKVVTKPSQHLVQELTNLGIKMPKGNSYAITMPQVQIYQESIIDSTVIALDDPLTDPFGNILSSGTKVTITGFNDDEITKGKNGQLTPGRILSYLKGKIDPDSVSIWVGDHTRNTQPQKVWTLVTKDEIKGTLVYGGTGTCEDGALFSINLFYDPVKEPNSPIVLRGKTQTFRLTQIEELDHLPWNKLGGEIGFPRYLIDAPLWNAQKDMLQETKEKKRWIRALLKLEPTIKELFRKAQQIHTEKSNQEFIDDFRQATMAALSSIDAFAGHRNPGIVDKNKNDVQSPAEEQEKRIRPGIRAKVISENGRGLFDIKVQLVDKWNNVIAEETTSVMGKITFGNYPNGSYRLRVVADPKLVRGAQEFRFAISTAEPGYTAIFKLAVDSGHEVRPRMKAKMLEPEWVTRPLHIQYEIDRDRGFLLFNIAHRDLNEALMKGDELMQLVLLSRYTSDAHALLLQDVEQGQVMKIAAELNARLFPLFREKRELRKSLLKGSKMRQNRK